jgi:GNAT superfamily N-acetyltransferase
VGELRREKKYTVMDHDLALQNNKSIWFTALCCRVEEAVAAKPCRDYNLPLNKEAAIVIRDWPDFWSGNMVIGVLYERSHVGLLADACVRPDFEGAGCRSALLRHRIRLVKEHSGDLLKRFVEFDSTSHHNLERAGLGVYTVGL